MFGYFSLTCLISGKSYISLAGDMGRLADAAARKPKGRSKKTTRGEKRKLDTKGKYPSPEHVSDPEHDHDAAIPEPEVAKMPEKPKAPKTKEASKENGIFIREGVPPIQSTLAPVGDKGKDVLEEPSPP